MTYQDAIDFIRNFNIPPEYPEDTIYERFGRDIRDACALIIARQDQYAACHEAHVNCERDLAACREVANGLRSKVSSLRESGEPMRLAILRYFVIGEMPKSFCHSVEQWEAEVVKGLYPLTATEAPCEPK